MDSISHSIDSFANWFSAFCSKIVSFLGSIGDVLSYVLSILSSLWYGLTSILSGLWGLFVDVVSGGVFYNVSNTFLTLSEYIGGTATIFISTLMLIIIFRIIIAFVFKFFRLNIDYKKSSSSK